MRRCIIGAVWLNLAFAAASAAQPGAQRVLLLNSFERGSAVENLFAGAFRTELSRQSLQPMNIFEVSLQPALAPYNPREAGVVDYLVSTFAGQRLDLVVTLGGPAAAFAQKYRERLFPSTPLLLAAVDQRSIQDEALDANETALAVATDAPQIIEGILQLLPETTNIFVVIGASEVEDFWRGELRRWVQPFQDRVTFVWSNDLSFADMLKRAASLPAHSAIFYTLLSVDAKGVIQTEERTLAELHAVANAPIFGLYDIQLGNGIVGGSLLSVEDLVRASASVAVRILRGESPGSIKTPPQTHGQPVFDWRELKRWGISEARLPARSTLRFRQPSVWNQYKSYIVGAAVLVGLQSALIAGLVVQRIRRRRTELALRRSYEQNQDLAGRLIDAQEAERRRIARDLHDDLSQQLAGMGIMLSGLKRAVGQPSSRSEIDETVSTLQDRTSALSEAIRSLSHELHPSVMEHAGLVATLQRHCSDIARHHQLTVTFHAGDDLDSLSPDVALCLFRVTQEALTNAVRHAGARTISVTLRATTGGVELSVVDDGVGFVTSERAGTGLGLRSIDERVRLSRGTLRVQSQPGQGTNVLVRIPAPPAGNPA